KKPAAASPTGRAHAPSTAAKPLRRTASYTTRRWRSCATARLLLKSARGTDRSRGVVLAATWAGVRDGRGATETRARLVGSGRRGGRICWGARGAVDLAGCGGGALGAPRRRQNDAPAAIAGHRPLFSSNLATGEPAPLRLAAERLSEAHLTPVDPERRLAGER